MSNLDTMSTRFLELATTEPDPTRPSVTPVVDAFGLTDQGRVRSRNEDAFLVASLERSLVVEGSSLPCGEHQSFGVDRGGMLLVVADGMGGMGGGDVASRVAVMTVAQHVVAHMPWIDESAARSTPAHVSLPEIRVGLDRAIQAGDERVKSVAQDGAHPHMGTTLTMAYVIWPRVYVVHAGDSRCYLFRAGKVHRLTRDHSVAEHMARSGMAPPSADSGLANVLWNALGADTQLEPEIARYALRAGDQLLLCTDGLTAHVPDESLAWILSQGSSAERCCRDLVGTANAAGGIDNITAIVARF